jgi:hypothetical protein
MGLGMVAWPYAERTPRLGHGSSSPPLSIGSSYHA